MTGAAIAFVVSSFWNISAAVIYRKRQGEGFFFLN
jgi:hypothetical protein